MMSLIDVIVNVVILCVIFEFLIYFFISRGCGYEKYTNS